MSIKQSVVFPMIKPEKMPLEELCKAAAGMGYAAIELWFRQDVDFDEVAELARRYKLVIASMCGHGTHARGLNQRAEHDRVEGELRESIEVAARHGVPGVIALSGNRNPGESDADAVRTCAEALKRIAPHAERKGVNVNLELLNSKVDHPGYFCDHTELGVAICELVASPRVKLLYASTICRSWRVTSFARSRATCAGSGTSTQRETRADRTWTMHRS